MVSKHKSIRWKSEAPAGLGRRMVRDRQVTHTVLANGDIVTLSIQCGECLGPSWTKDIEMRPIFGFFRRPRASVSVPLRCECGEKHKDAPDGDPGCGRRFRLEIG